MLQIPNIIKNADCAGLPISFEWNEEISSKFSFSEDLNLRMAKAFDEANYRTNVTLTVCVFEWFVRRFEGVMDLTDAYLRLEAAWACAIHPCYLNDDRFEDFELEEAPPLPADNVLKVGYWRIWNPLKVFLASEIGLAGDCVNLALLAHYVMSEPNAFDNWLEAALRKGTTTFPREVESYDFDENFYEYMVEKIVPREFFFDPDFEYSDDAAMDVLQQFLDSLNPDNNPYLNTADEMKAEGYPRTPYKMIDLKKG